VHSTTPREITIRGGTVDKKYNFDQVFGEAVTQFEIYNRVVAPMISNIISGYNCTVFLYGQSGTGKTYTMLGPNPINPEADLQQVNEIYTNQDDLNFSNTSMHGIPYLYFSCKHRLSCVTQK
jgi:hypothetical protein